MLSERVKQVLCVIWFAFVLVFIILGFMTPEFTKYDEYTDVIKYWTDDVYFRNNF